MNKKIGRPQLILTEAQVRYAMQNSFGNKDASRFLKVDYRTYKRWAKQHIDSDTGKTLFELHSKIGVPLTREKKDNIKVKEIFFFIFLFFLINTKFYRFCNFYLKLSSKIVKAS